MVFQKFIKKHLQELLNLGVPLRTLEEPDGWVYLLEHGKCYLTHWKPDNLSKGQLLKLIELIEEFAEGKKYSLTLKAILLNHLSNLENELTS